MKNSFFSFSRLEIGPAAGLWLLAVIALAGAVYEVVQTQGASWSVAALVVTLLVSVMALRGLSAENKLLKRMDEVLAVRPGLTGLWQVSGRNNLSYEERVDLDVRYARHRSVRMDLTIIFKTMAVILDPRDRGAY